MPGQSPPQLCRNSFRWAAQRWQILIVWKDSFPGDKPVLCIPKHQSWLHSSHGSKKWASGTYLTKSIYAQHGIFRCTLLPDLLIYLYTKTHTLSPTNSCERHIHRVLVCKNVRISVCGRHTIVPIVRVACALNSWEYWRSRYDRGCRGYPPMRSWLPMYSCEINSLCCSTESC